MTNKEAMQALLDGKKIRQINWRKNIYIYFDSEKDRLSYNDGSFVYLPFTTDTEYEEYKELLTDKEREYLKSLVSVYSEEFKKRLVIKCFGNTKLKVLHISNCSGAVNDVVSIQLFPLTLLFSGLENLKYYSLEELGLND